MKIMRPALLLVTALAAMSAHADQLIATRSGVFVAGAQRTALVRDGRTVWTGGGVETAGALVADDTRAVVLDPLRNEATTFDLATGARTTVRTAETPVAAELRGDELFVLARDARSVERIAGSGTRRVAATGADPAFLRFAGNLLVVYSRGDGRLQLIDPSSMRVVREGTTSPFASDLEIDGKTIYLVYPRDAVIRQVELATLAPAGQLKVGAVPVDLAIGGGGNALSARTLSIADPAARRVWAIEGRQSIAQAFARGFLRGLIGLGLFRNDTAEFPTGVDRVMWHRGQAIAYDTSTGTLYRIVKKQSTVIAKGVEPGAFALTGEGVVWLVDGELRAERSGRGTASGRSERQSD